MLSFIKNGKGKILKLFFKDPDKEYYLREIARELGQEPGFFQNSLESLVKDNILKDERRANLRFFRLNKENPLYEEIKKIVSKVFGIEALLKKIVDDLPEIEYAFIFGSIAKGIEYSDSDIDLMIIGSVNEDELIQKVNKVEDELKREINYHIYTKNEFIDKMKTSEFIIQILKEPKIIIKGNLNDVLGTNINN